MKTILCPVQEAAQNNGDKNAILSGDKRISYEQLHLSMQHTQSLLEKKGVRQGARIALIANPGIEYIHVLWALWRMKVVVCLMNTRFPLKEIIQQYQKLDLQFVITSEEYALSLENSGVKILDLKSLVSYDVKQRDDLNSKEYRIALDQEATIVFTSGTSSEPKVVLHTFGNHYFNARGSNENIPVAPGDRWLLSLPVYHVSGLSILFRIVLGQGTLVLYQNDEDISSSVQKYSITHLSLVPTQLIGLLTESYPSLKTILLGGAPIPPALLQNALEHNLPVYITYGLTEMASQVATTRHPIVPNPPLSVPGTRYSAYKSPILKYRALNISRQGEILVKGKTLCKGYWKEGKCTLTLTTDGWFATGDLGALDEEGNLTVTGRKDNMFVSGGENIYPEEIERQLLNMSEIKQALVVPIPDGKFGFRPAAFVNPQANTNVSVVSLNDNLETVLPRFKIPRFYYAWPEELKDSGIKMNRKFFRNLVDCRKEDLKEIR